MDNIVTGGSVNLPNNTPQGSLVPVPEDNSAELSSAVTAANAAAGNIVAETAAQETQEEALPTEQGNTPPTGETGLAAPSGPPIQAIQPITSIGLPPWLVNNPNIQQLMPDIPNWREYVIEAQRNAALGEPRNERTLLDIPYAYPQASTPLLDDSTGRNLSRLFDEMQTRDREQALRSELGRFMDIRPPGQELSNNPGVPNSNRSILRNNMRQGTGEPETSGNPIVRFAQDWFNRSRTQVEVLGSAAQDLWSMLSGGEGSEEQRQAFDNLVYEYVLGNPTTGESSGEPINNAADTLRELGQVFPRATQRGLEGLSNALPEEDPTTVSGYRNDWTNGYFGEYGRGWVGAFNTGLSFFENLGMAGVYSATDLAVGLTNRVGLDVPYLRDVNVDFDNSGPLYRFRQAFGGVDLDVTNVRDGSGNRYLNFIDPNADTQTQIQQGAAGLAISAIFGGGVDDALSGGLRVARTYAEAYRRTGDVQQALEASSRLRRIQDLRRARQSVPTFSGQREVNVNSENPNLPPVYSPAVGELPELSPSAGVVVNLDEFTNPVPSPDWSSFNIAPVQLMEEFNIDPMATPPLPFMSPRTNDELLNLGQQLGDIDLSQDILTNADIQRLQQVFGGTYSRFGRSVEFIEGLRQQRQAGEIGARLEAQRLGRQEQEARIEMLIDEGVELETIRATLDDTHIVRQSQLQVEQNNALRRTGEPTADDESRVQELIRLSDEPTLSNTIIWEVDESPKSLRADPRNVQEYLGDMDNYMGASRGLQDLETEMDALRRTIIRDAQPVIADGYLVKYGRGRIADEIATSTLYDNVIPGTQVQELLPPIEPPVTPAVEGWYHGTKQLDIQNINYHHGAAHEWGLGLYLTSDTAYANVASRAYRTENNPVPGTTRLQPEGQGQIFSVHTDATNFLEANSVSPSDVFQEFSGAVRAIFGKRFAEQWRENIGTPTAGELWLRTRQLYADLRNQPVPEVRYREFSREVANRLKNKGYDGIQDNTRGMRLIFPGTDGRISMNAIPFQTGIGIGNKTEALYARHWMDAELRKSLPSPVTEAWENQSRIKLGNAMMEDLMKAYGPAARQTQELLQDMLDMERKLSAEVHALNQTDLDTLIESAPEAALRTPEFERYRDTPIDDPCI